MSRTFVIVGADTNVGKTVFAANENDAAVSPWRYVRYVN